MGSNFKNLKVEKIKFNNFINFLRAISVFSVIVYHSDIKILNGGWLGVDIFFVISGYLIANGILSNLEEFNLKNFYFKRYKRIIPALVFTILLTIPLSILLMTPKSLIEFSNSLLPSLFFYSNVFFSNVETYTSELAKFNPLLHIWSLSVEEQFYLMFPILIVCFSKNLKFFSKIIVLLISLSLLLDVIEIETFKFYLPQYRVWEILLGVSLNFLNFKFKNNKMFYLLFIVLIFSLFYFDDSYIYHFYPKLITLISVAFLILLTRDEKKLNLNFYQNKYLQKIGKASFSSYLLHQPIFAFYKLFQLKFNYYNDNLFIDIILILTILYLGSLSFKFIEQKYINNHSAFKFFLILIASTVIVFFSIFINNFKGYSSREDLPAKVVEYTDIDKNSLTKDGILCHNLNVNDLCIFSNDNSNYSFYVIGDSAFRSTSIYLAQYRELYNYDFTNITGSACVFLFNKIPDIWACPNIEKDEMDKFVGNINDSIIFYVARFPLYIEEVGFTNGNYKEDLSINIAFNFENELNNTIKKLLKNNNLIVLVYPIPEQGWNVPNLFLNNLKNWSQDVFYDYDNWKLRSKSSYDILDKINHQNIIRVYPETLFCDSFIKDSCVGKYGNYLFYGDDDHLSIEGGELLAQYLLEELFIKNKDIIVNFSR